MRDAQQTEAVRLTLHERRIARRMTARSRDGLVEAMTGYRGCLAGERFRIGPLYAVGGEGAVFEVTDEQDPARQLVAKIALHSVDRPFRLSSEELRRRRYGLRVEAQYLLANDSAFMPEGVALVEFDNPLMDHARGDAFAELEPVLVMERLPGHDLDRWLALAHRREVPRAVMRRTLDRVAVVLTQALTDLRGRGLLYADLRPGNMRMMGRPDRRVRMLDAGSLVAANDRSGRFPHVGAYLPPPVFEAHERGERIVPTDAIQAIMAGRTLFEVATGRVPLPGTDVDVGLLAESNVSAPVAEVVEALCVGDFPSAQTALKYLSRRAKRRVVGGNATTAPRRAARPTTKRKAAHPAQAAVPGAPAHRAPAPVRDPVKRPAADAAPTPPDAAELPAASVPPRSLVRRILGRVFG